MKSKGMGLFKTIFLVVLIIIFLYKSGLIEKFIPSIEKQFNLVENQLNTVENPAVNNNSTDNLCNDMYEEIKKGLLEVKSTIDISNCARYDSTDVIFNTIEEVVNENPEILYYEGCEYIDGILKPRYSKDREEIIAHQKIVRERKSEVINNIINKEMTNYEKEKAIHDYIVNNTKYDERFFTNEGVVSPESHTVYGVLVEGVAVCGGYAKTMKYLLDEVGIDSIVISGIANDINHAWNMVKLDNEYYHVDCTWDDPVLKDGSDTIIYDYFNINDKDIRVSHNWEEEKYPNANGVKYNYYHYNNLTINNYDEFYKSIKNAILNRDTTFERKILDSKEIPYDIKGTIEKVIKNHPLGIRSIRYTYSTNKDLGIIKITFNYE